MIELILIYFSITAIASLFVKIDNSLFCGLAGLSANQEATVGNGLTEKFLAALVDNEARGRDSTGIYGRTLYKSIDEASKAVAVDRKDILRAARAKTVIGHTRLATTGWIDVDSAHPFLFSNLVGTHNGTIHNIAKVAAQHNIIYDDRNDVDSKILYEILSKTNLDLDVIHDMYGFAALAFVNNDGHLFLYRRKNRPLYIREFRNGDQQGILYSSREESFEKAGLMSPIEIEPYKVFEFKDGILYAEHDLKELKYDIDDDFTSYYIPYNYPDYAAECGMEDRWSNYGRTSSRDYSTYDSYNDYYNRDSVNRKKTKATSNGNYNLINLLEPTPLMINKNTVSNFEISEALSTPSEHGTYIRGIIHDSKDDKDGAGSLMVKLLGTNVVAITEPDGTFDMWLPNNAILELNEDHYDGRFAILDPITGVVRYTKVIITDTMVSQVLEVACIVNFQEQPEEENIESNDECYGDIEPEKETWIQGDKLLSQTSDSSKDGGHEEKFSFDSYKKDVRSRGGKWAVNETAKIDEKLIKSLAHRLRVKFGLSRLYLKKLNETKDEAMRASIIHRMQETLKEGELFCGQQLAEIEVFNEPF